MVTSIGDSSDYDGYLADNSTPADGTYAWYFKCNIPRTERNYPLVSGSFILGAEHQNTTGKQIGQRQITETITGMKVSAGTHYDNMKKALSYWSKNDSQPYFYFKDESSNERSTVSSSAQALVTRRVFVTKQSDKLIKGAGYYNVSVTLLETL